MKKSILFLGSLGLAACANHTPTKNAAMSTPFFMGAEDTIEIQRPANPATHFVKWEQGDRLYGGIVVDFIGGMSQRDYLFKEPNKRLFVPMLEYALQASNLKAGGTRRRAPGPFPEPWLREKPSIEARYALQIRFREIDVAKLGADFAGKTRANYTLVDRSTGEIVYSRDIGSNFLAIYPELNEYEVSRAYNISAPGVLASTYAFAKFAIGDGVVGEAISQNSWLSDFFGDYDEASQATWNDAYQGYAWATGISALSGPLVIALEQMDPRNYLNINLWRDDEPDIGAQVRNGPLSTTGFGSRNGLERARQLNAQLLSQSITLFLIDLSRSEGVPLTQLVPCNKLDNSTEAIMASASPDMRIITDDCMKYVGRKDRPGVAITSWK